MSELVRIKKLFLNMSALEKYVDKKNICTLNRFGATQRKVATQSMRSRKSGHSPAGTPPFAHGTKLLRKLYFYVVDPRKKSVVCGPLRLGKTARLHVPKFLEGGGVVTRRIKNKMIVAKYPSRAYTEPAAQKTLPMVPRWYAGA